MKLDLHIHSKYSYDSFSESSKIVKMAKRKGLDIISITDHDKQIVLKKERNCYGKGTPFYISHGYSFIAARIKRVRV